MLKFVKIGAVSVVALAAASSAASAAEGVSGDFGYNINSHFVSYGADVWGAGSSIYGSQTTSSVYADINVKLTDSLTWTNNAWSDINTNVPSAIGGSLQEVDFNTGLSYSFGSGFTGSVVYGAWTYAGGVEEIIDLSLGYDDTELTGIGFFPKLTFHNRVSGIGAQQVGSAVVFGVGPTFPVFGGFSLTIPAGVAFFTTDDFQGGTESGFGYAYIGGSLGTPLAFVPESYGAWSANLDVIGYFTNSSAIPGNPVENFATVSFNIKMGF